MGNHDPKDSKGSNLPVPYEVGYAKPPVEHLFTKGSSGNLRGRPKGAMSKAKPVNTETGRKPTEEFLLLEAYRSVCAMMPNRSQRSPTYVDYLHRWTGHLLAQSMSPTSRQPSLELLLSI